MCVCGSLKFTFCHLFRVRSYIKNGWADNIINPDEISDPCCLQASSSSLSSSLNTLDTVNVWKDIRKAYSCQNQVPKFSYGHMMTYFVSRTLSDGLPAGDFNAMNTKAKRLYDCGHIQNIEVSTSGSKVCIRASCLPEMKKDVYKVSLSLCENSFDIETAVCGCKAGKGPKASCKHVGALCYAFAEFCKSGHLPDFLTCTEQLQKWNQPRPRKVEVIPVSSRKNKLLKKQEDSFPVPSCYDPRPISMRSSDPQLIETLRVNLLAVDSHCALLQLLVPPVKVALHDHQYGSHRNESTVLTSNETDMNELQKILAINNNHPTDQKSKLNVTLQERKRIEENTRCQSNSSLWHVVRARRITASKCGKILCQIKRTDSLLIDVLYPKRMDPNKLPAPIKWGIDNECHACEAYVAHMQKNGHEKITTRPCGFIIHPTMGWLGASPDSFVADPSNILSDGIAEFKCPFTKKDLSPFDACQDPTFYCTMSNNQLHLNRNHHYYHQVQLQLFVCMDMCQWCDFCIYTLKGVAVERIWLDTDWCNMYISELESYFDGYMLPEIISPKLKPSYVL